jgi:nucleotide-binding universal stress UspA family protein
MKILAAIDFSTATESVLKTTKIYAEKLDAEVCLIHVEPPPVVQIGSEPGLEIMSAGPPCRETELARLRKNALALKKSGIKVSQVLLQGAVSKTILEEAERQKADLIIAGSHGHSILRNVLIGSTSEGILRHTRIPLLLIPIKG